MRRRTVGLVIIALALFAALIVPTVGGRAVPGRPQAAVIPAPPVVGDCITSPISVDTDTEGRPSVDPAGVVHGPCDGERYGEVVGLLDADAVYQGPDLAVIDGYCSVQTQRFQGLPEALIDRQVAGIWQATVSMPVLSLAPTELEQAAGRTWTACVTFPVSETGPFSPYRTSLAGVYATGVPPASSGSCRDVADLTAGQPVPCAGPHGVEDFGWAYLFGDGGPSPTDEESLAGCRELVALLTRSPGLPGDGGLAVTVTSTPTDGGSGDSSQSWCRVVATDGRTLTGSLLGLADGPVPWS